MGTCKGCANVFPNHQGRLCEKCIKLDDASAVDREVIMAYPQCKMCSCVYPYMQGTLCGPCRNEEAVSAGRRLTIHEAAAQGHRDAEEVLSAARAHSSKASDQRLNQDHVNPGLQAANLKKEKIRNLQKQNKTSNIDICATLYYFGKKGGQAKQAQLLSASERFWGTDSAALVFAWAKKHMKTKWESSPASQGLNPFNFEDAAFGIGTKAGASDIQLANYAHLTVDAMYSALGNKLSATDKKEHKLPLRICAYETRDDIVTDEEDDEDLEVPASRPASRIKAGAKSSARAVAAKSTAVRALSSKRKASKSITEADKYQSSFRPRKIANVTNLAPQLTIEYDDYTFTRTTFTIDTAGNIDEQEEVDTKEIKISRNWMKHVGDQPRDGFLGQGASKYAILGLLGDEAYAILFLKPRGADIDPITEEQNLKDLQDELRLLQYGQYFADSFARRAKAYAVEVPTISWNAAGAFIGVIRDGPTSSDGHLNGPALPFRAFLATRRIQMTPLHQERKFSGSIVAGRSIDMGGQIIDAYAHHVLVDTSGRMLLSDLQGVVSPDKSIVLFDPQAHTLDKVTGVWDDGDFEISHWKLKHHCNGFCKKLKLPAPTATLESLKHPLRHGFDA